MGFLMVAAATAFVLWITIRSMGRDRAARNRAEAAMARIRQAHAIQDVFVSREDGSFVGLSEDGGRIVLGQGDQDRPFPVVAIVAVEGLRDGTVLVRAEPASDPVVPAAEQDVTDLPDRIRSLTLRVHAADEVFDILFFDGGRHGVPPLNETFRKQAAKTEAWFRKVSAAMRSAG